MKKNIAKKEKIDFWGKCIDLFNILDTNDSIGPLSAFTVAFTLLTYKRLSDLHKENLTTIEIPKGCKWTNLRKTKRGPFPTIDKRIKEIIKANPCLNNIENALTIPYNAITISVQEQVVELISKTDLSTASYPLYDSEVSKDISGMIDVEPDNNGFNFYENQVFYAVSKLAVKILDPKEGDFVYVPECGYGDTLIAVIDHMAEKASSSGNTDASSLIKAVSMLKGSEKNHEFRALAVLRMLLSGVDPDILANIDENDYLSEETYKFATSFYKEKTYGSLKYEDAIKDIEKLGLQDQIGLLGDQLFHAIPPHIMFLNLPNGFPLTLPPRDDDFWGKSYDIPKEIVIKGKQFVIPENYGELMFLLIALKQLDSKGRMGIILPKKILYDNTGDIPNIRKLLIENDLIETIISFSHEIDYFWRKDKSRNVLMILNKDKKANNKGKVAFLRAYVAYWDNVEEDPSCRIPNQITDTEIDRIVDASNNMKTTSDSDYIATTALIRKNRYILNPKLYENSFINELKAIKRTKSGVELGEVANIEQRSGYESSYQPKRGYSEYPLILKQHLNDDITRPYISNDLNHANIKTSGVNKYLLTKTSLIVSNTEQLNPTIFDHEILNKGVLTTNDTITITPKSKLDIEYLYYQFYSDLVLKQIKTKKIIDIETLKSIIIPLPETLKVQRRYADKKKTGLLEEADKKVEDLKERLRIKEEEKQEAEFQIIRHIAHGIKPKINIIKSPINALSVFLKDRSLLGETLSVRLDGSKETVKEALEIPINTINQIAGLIESTRELVTNKINREDFQEVNIKAVFNNEIIPLHTNKSYKIHINTNAPNFKLHKRSFIEAINNLIRNAEIHAFYQNNSKEAEVSFLIKKYKEDLIINYTNNGVPFPKDISEKDFLTFGEKGKDSLGEGLGGAWIGKFIDAHSGTFEIVRDKYPVHFRIIIPKEK